MNVHGLNDPQRQRLQATLTRHRDGVDAIIKRMQDVGWYTDDAMFQTLLAARHSLHAAINSFAPPERPAQKPQWAARMEGKC